MKVELFKLFAVGLISSSLLSYTPLALAQNNANKNQEPVITVDGVSFATWADYLNSNIFTEKGLRCGTRGLANQPQAALVTDCDYSFTNPSSAYDPIFVYDVPVVVHVIQNSGGTGFISQSLVQSQIDILNEDFLAIMGSNGENGNNGLVQFHLATEDPAGNPTNGITYSTNTTWFNDGGSYWNTLAWDTNRYLNIYTNSASGALGYVPDLPQGGIVGNTADRVVVLWSAFGRNAPIGPPYDQGRTATHEVGHYFGLHHTFNGGCAPAGTCYINGDYICDTNPEQNPQFGCPNSNTCGSPDPTDNYMDYTDDLCMEQFTNEQVRRMRCTVEFWRPNLAPIVAMAVTRNGSGINPLGYVSLNLPVIGTNWNSTIDIATPGATNSILMLGIGGPTSGAISGIGELLTLPPFLNFLGTGNYSLPVPSDPAFLGVTINTQGATVGGPGGLQLTNAIDITLGN